MDRKLEIGLKRLKMHVIRGKSIIHCRFDVLLLGFAIPTTLLQSMQHHGHRRYPTSMAATKAAVLAVQYSAMNQ